MYGWEFFLLKRSSCNRTKGNEWKQFFSNACGCTEFWCVCHAAEWAEIKEIYWKFSAEDQVMIKPKMHGNDSKDWSINFTGTCWESVFAVSSSCALDYQWWFQVHLVFVIPLQTQLSSAEGLDFLIQLVVTLFLLLLIFSLASSVEILTFSLKNQEDPFHMIPRNRI